MANFSDHIPELVMQNPATIKLLNVLDELNNRKQEEIHPYTRSWNPVLSTNKEWIVKQLADYGISDIPTDLPLIILQQVLLNVDTICGTRGSKIGIQLFLSVFSLGEATVDDSGMYVADDVLMLDHATNAYITESTTQSQYYLVNDTSQINKTSTLSLTVESKFFNGDYPAIANAIKVFLSEENISKQLPFSADRNIAIEFFSREEFYFHKLLNKFFV